MQFAACFIMIAWVCSLSGAMFFILNKFGLLRVTRDVEEAGADVSKHGGSAYPEQMVPANGSSGAPPRAAFALSSFGAEMSGVLWFTKHPSVMLEVARRAGTAHKMEPMQASST